LAGIVALLEFRHPGLDSNDTLEDPSSYRGAYQVAFESVRDYGSGRTTLHRWETEVQQRIPGFKPGQRLTLHGFLASTNTARRAVLSAVYPGRSGGLHTFRPDMLGGDGTRATLRGFTISGFRDRNLGVDAAEYRIPFTDTCTRPSLWMPGQVAPRTSELFSHIRANTGFSLSYMRKGERSDGWTWDFGGGEGVHVFWSFGAFRL
jgi:hypothetical protein